MALHFISIAYAYATHDFILGESVMAWTADFVAVVIAS